MNLRGNNYPVRLLLFIIMFPSLAFAGHLYKEKVYQEAWCKKMGGETEVVLDDRTRVDCITSEYAVEVDFAPKWAESVGQSLYYALKTGRKPGVLLILEKPGDERYLQRITDLGAIYEINIWTIRPQDVGEQ